MGLKIPPLALTCLLMVFMFILSWSFPQYSFSILENVFISLVVMILGGFFSIMGVASFRSARTTVNPNAPENTSSLVISGVYRVSRNPMYLGFLLLLIAWGIFLSNSLALFLFPTIFVLYMNFFQIPLEEKALLNKFGDEFVLYKAKVRMWL